MDFDSYLKAKCGLIEKRLDELVPEKDVPYNQLFHAARYALMGNAKRLRPLLTLATTETLGGSSETALSSACALEMIHTYSLIHDDLPCMDNDDFRRGKPSLHRAFPEGHALLTGDYLLTYAFEVIIKDPHLFPEQKVALIDLLAKNSGGEGMIGGQVMDLEAAGKQIDMERLSYIHRCKTGAIITTAIAFGGVIANASTATMQILQHFGENLGLAFQIIDDVIDVTACEQKHGKAISSDYANHKTTYVTLLGLEKAQQMAKILLLQALQHLQQLSADITLLAGIADRLVHRKI
jgi:geranylgeranyl diphosphate synthase, type II